jgi:hypothetical protein
MPEAKPQGNVNSSSEDSRTESEEGEAVNNESEEESEDE